MYSFSVEVTNEFSDDMEWDEQRPYNFLCGSIASDKGVDTYWDAEWLYETLIQIPPQELYTWNATHFDFLCLKDDSVKVNHQFVLGHRDMMFDMFCRLGYPISLVSVLRGFHYDSDADAIEQERSLMLAYIVSGNVQAITQYNQFKTQMRLKVAQTVIEKGGLVWITGEGIPKWVVLDEFQTVEENMKLDVSNDWVEDPFHKEDFVGWLK